MPLATATAPVPLSSEASRSSKTAVVGIADSRIDVAVLLQVEKLGRLLGIVEDVGRRLVNGHGAGPDVRVGDVSRVQHAGFKPVFADSRTSGLCTSLARWASLRITSRRLLGGVGVLPAQNAGVPPAPPGINQSSYCDAVPLGLAASSVGWNVITYPIAEERAESAAYKSRLPHHFRDFRHRHFGKVLVSRGMRSNSCLYDSNTHIQLSPLETKRRSQPRL